MAYNFLIVDDSSTTRTIIKKIVGLSKLDVGNLIEAENWQEAIDKLKDNWVDLVIADINMPVMNGLEMIDEIQSDDSWHNLPIVVISTEGSQTRIDNLHDIGVEFIHKPFTPEAIRNVLINKLGINHV